MGLFDVKTLSLVALVTSLLLPLVLTTSAQFTSSGTTATRTLINGALAYAVGFLLLALRGSIPDWLSFFIGNVLIVGGFAELAIGMQLYLRGRANRGWMVLITVGNAICMYSFVIVAPNPSQRVFTSSLFLLPICLLLAVEFLAAARRAGASDERGASAEKRLLLALAVVFLLSALSFSWRAHNFWNVHGDINPATTGGQTWGLSFMVGVLLNIMLATCMPLLISRRNQRELSRSQALLEETERLADVGSFLYDPASDRISPNGVMRAWLNLGTPRHLNLASFLSRLEAEQAWELKSQVSAIAAGHQATWEGECRMAVPDDGLERWLSVHCGRGLDASGHPYVIVSARNITAFRAATQAAIEARDEADRANAAKSVFLANMSHEIRTPMNGVLGLTRLCLDGDLPPRERNLITKCHESAQSLLGIVNDILDFSKIEAGQLTLEALPFHLDHTIESARNLFEESAGGKGLRFVVDVASDVPRGLVGDALRLSQILNNFLSNAVKFTEHGEVRLRIRQHPAPSAAGRVFLEFAVQDSGIGMSAAQRERLFQPFSQADASTTRKYGGSGLGLVICARLTALMDGTLELHSEEGKGSTIQVTLPFGLSNQALGQPRANPERRQQKLRGLRILLVEDNAINVLVATLSLQRAGAHVVHRENGQLAVDYLRDHAREVDVVLMDIQMPVMDGYTATRIIRGELGLQDLPVIAMTANVLESDRQASQHAGMNAHVGKPFDMAQLVNVILQSVGANLGHAVETKNLATSEPTAVDGHSAVLPVTPLLDLGPALQRMGNNVQLLAQAARSFDKDVLQMLQDLRQSGSSEKGSTPVPILHTLKGLGATLGLTRLSHAAAELESSARSGTPLSAADIDALEAVATPSLDALRSAIHRLSADEKAVLAQEPVVSVASTDLAESHDRLTHLHGLLANADMAALEYFAQHRDDLEASLGPHIDAMTEALQALDFAAAMQQCEAALQAK
jgi:signal transduction histidine kinase/CheY-like chemotaxis protein